MEELSMTQKDLRGYLELLKKQGPEEIRFVDKTVDPRFELTAVIAKLESLNRYPALVFNRVQGFSLPVVSNLFSSRKRLAIALGCDEKDLNQVFRTRENHRIEPMLVRSGPVKEVIQKKAEVDVSQLPIVTHNEKDVGPYITAGAMVVKDPETGIRNVGIYRHMLQGKNQIGVHLSEASHSNFIFDKYCKRGKPMEVAITIGMHPLFYLGVLSFVPFGVDEYTVVGGLMQDPLEVVKCETVDLEIPAAAEIVVEGVIQPGSQRLEGAFGEYTTLYGKPMMNPVIDITAITMRKDPIYLDIFSGHIDHQLVGGTPRLSSIYKAVQVACPTVKDIYMPPSGYCRLTCYISIQKRHEGEPKNAICAAFGVDPFIRYAVVVDTDVNIFDDSSMWRAVTSRVRVDEDVFMIRNAKGHPLDPMARKGFLVDKIGIDATKPLSDYPETVSVPGVEKIKLDQYLT
jgi:2,5-furandicarboxylate decarboxylase 1